MYKRNNTKTSLDFSDTISLAEQHHKDAVSIQTIVQQHHVTGTMPINSLPPQFSDQSDLPSFHEAQIILAKGIEAFEAVPAHIRKEFDNDPAEYLEFIQNPDNREEIIAYGLDASHIPEDYVTPPSPEEEKQIHLEDLIKQQISSVMREASED